MRRAAQACSSLLAHVAHLQPIRVAVAHPLRCPQPVRCARSALRGVDRAGAGVTHGRLEAVATEAGLDLADVAIVDVPHSHAAARSKPSPWRPKVKSKP